MLCKGQSWKGPRSPLCFPGHTGGSLGPRAVSQCPTLHCASCLTSKGLLPLAPLQVTLQELSYPAMQSFTANWDFLPFACLLWHHSSTSCTLPSIHNIHRESPEWNHFSIMFLTPLNILIFIMISSTLSDTEGYITNPNPTISSTIFCQEK